VGNATWKQEYTLTELVSCAAAVCSLGNVYPVRMQIENSTYMTWNRQRLRLGCFLCFFHILRETNAKLSLCLIVTPLGSLGEWSYSCIILELASRWRWVVSFIPQPFNFRKDSSRQPLCRRLDGPPESVRTLRRRELSLASAGNQTRRSSPSLHFHFSILSRPALGSTQHPIILILILYSFHQSNTLIQDTSSQNTS
jgi:hypothetical protein